MRRLLGFGVAGIILGIVGAGKAYSATDEANALQKVIAALKIEQVSDLNFGEAAVGDGSKPVAPGTTDDAENASFNVTGEPSRLYNITLPPDGSIVMTTGAGNTPDTQIAVDSFTSFPSSQGQLDTNGDSLLLVGATRAALTSSQVPGDYVGTFTVEVVYQ